MSPADALLKVIALMRDGSAFFSTIRYPIFMTIVVVFPDPGEASRSIGPPV
jgi:hypothetical protein